MQGNVLAVGGAVFALGVAGCGGSSGPLTKAEFVKQGNALCSKVRHQTMYTHTDIATRFIDYETTMLRSLHTLKPPAELQSRVDTYEHTVVAARALMRQVKVAADKQRPIKALEGRLSSLATQQVGMATALGLTACRPGG